MSTDNALELALFTLRNEQEFMGGLLQELNMKYSNDVPSGGITFNKALDQYEIHLNPTYFKEHLNNDLRVGLLHHEIQHFTSKHLLRFDMGKHSPEDSKIMNYAGDMAINQYLPHIAKGCPTCPHDTEEKFLEAKCPGIWIDVNNFKLDDGSPFPKLKNMEFYYDLIKEEKKKQKDNPNTKGNVNQKIPETHHTDVHTWEEVDEETRQQMIKEAKKLIKRTIEKTSFGSSRVPGSIKDLLEELETMDSGINAKRILQNAIKKNASSTDRTSTWTRPNRRFGQVAPGSKSGTLPKVAQYFDSSGSISQREMNLFLDIGDEFLKVGSRQCMLGLWHTELYYKKKYKLGSRLAIEDIQSGGTDVTPVLLDIQRTSPDLALILTDFYFEMPNIPVNSEVIWIVSSGGNKQQTVPQGHKVIFLDDLMKGK